MAVILAVNYSKKLGLPNYSSHSCSVSLTVEIPDPNAASQEVSNLYHLLQLAVDSAIRDVGFIPDATKYGMNNNGHQSNGSNGHNGSEQWQCTEGQRGMILRLVEENKLDKSEVEGMAQQMFGVGVRHLDRMQASNLIDELLTKCGKTPARNRWSKRQPARS